MSILLNNITGNPERNPQLSFVIANAMYESIKFLAQDKNSALDIKLKWPNDVLVNERKIGGILLESISFGKQTHIVIGLGVNITEAPITVSFPATSLYDQGIILNHPDEFLNVLMNKFEVLYNNWRKDNNFIKTRDEWMSRAYNINKVITIENNHRRFSGIFKGIGLDGSMLLELSSGEICKFTTGNVLKGK
jgi:BirA family biotin operon repressor/biotin-[acetyl-CoA-carboxylase] ligase